MAASSSSSSSPFSYAPVAINPRIETDEVLGALPENWQLSQWGKRSLFVDHELKITTWIDPRTYNLRKHDIREVVPGELPYGWEEAFDQVCGVYYIDHVTRANFLEGPWNPEVQEQVLEMRSKLEGDARRLADQLELEYVKRQEVVQVEENLKKLEATRRRIESELMLMRQQAFDEAMGITSSSQGYGNGGGGGGGTEEEMKLREELVEIENALEQEKIEFEYVTEEHEAIQFEIDEFQNRLAELHAVNERLAIENMDLVEQAETTNHNLMEMREMIEAEAHQRRVLEDYIRSLKTEVIGLFDPDQAEHIRGYDELMRDPEHEETAPLPDIGSLDPRMELLALRARLEDEKEEKRVK